jgi:hypothetical protein
VTAEGVVTITGAGDVTINGIAPETRNFKRTVVSYIIHVAKASPVFAFAQPVIDILLGEAVPENALSVGLYDGTVVYTSSDEAVATVASDGTVTALAPGDVTITATGPETGNCNAAVQAQYLLTITDPDGIQSLTSDPSSVGEGSIYDLSGRRISGQMVNGKWSNGQLPKGLYIMGGKKILR